MTNARLIVAIALVAGLGMALDSPPQALADPATAEAAATFPGTNGRIAFTLSSPAAGRNIYTARPDGTGQRQLTTTGNDSQPAWSPEGSRVVYRRSSAGSRGDIFVMRANGQRQRLLVGGPAPEFDPAWSPDGRQVVFARGRYTPHLWIYNLRTRQLSQLTTPAKDRFGNHYSERTPAWSPNGKWIAFTRWVDAPEYSTVWRVRPDGTDLHGPDVHLRDRGINSVSWAPQGRRVALGLWQFDERQSDTCARGIVVVRPDGSDRRVLHRHDGNRCSGAPTWSPDGSLIAFTDTGPRAEDGTFPDEGIWLTTPGGHRQGLVIPGATEPSWQPR